MKKNVQHHILFILIVTLVALFMGVKTYAEYRNLANIDAKIHYEKAAALKQFMEAFRTTYQQIFLEQHSTITEQTLQFLPTVTISKISEELKKRTREQISINTVTSNPRNPINRANELENEAIIFFKSNPQASEFYKDITVGSSPFFFYASPLYIDKTCLQCHGKKEMAPSVIQEKYSMVYNYQEGDLRGIISIRTSHYTIEKDLFNLYFIKTTLATLLGSLLFLGLIFYLIHKIRKKDDQYTRELENTVQEKTKELHTQITRLQEYSKALDASAIVSKGDLNGKITYVNDKMCEATGYSVEELLGQPHSILRHPDMKDSIFKKMWATLIAKSIWQGLVKNRKKDGSYSWVQSTICPILDSNGDIQEFIAARNDVTELVEKRQELQKMLTTDSLTNLPNRFQLLKDMEQLKATSLILVDILDFADINDFFGTKTGDLVLIEFSQRIQQEFADKPFKLYRLHGDQVALLLIGVYPLKQFINSAKHLIEIFNQNPFKVQEEQIAVHITCGIAWNVETPLQEADMALKQAQATKKSYVVNNEDTNFKQELEKNLTCAINIKAALREERIVTFFQPIVNASTHSIEKYECLVRLIKEDGGIVSPFFFLDIAKKARLYPQITKAVINNSCKTFQHSTYDFSINLSTEDILDPTMVNFLKMKLEKAALADRVILEILETEGVENYEQVALFIKEMKGMGCKIAIDDFGTGHSNYEHLLNLNVDYLKIDGSIIKKITTDDISATIVETIVTVAKKLKIETVAEFVFDEATARKATALGVDYLQGYYFSEPLATIAE